MRRRMVQRCAGVSEAKRSVRYSCGESKQSTADGFDEEPLWAAFAHAIITHDAEIRQMYRAQALAAQADES